MAQAIDINVLMMALANFSNAAGSFLFYFAVGIAPCIVWLMLYLAQDRHPEPKKEILIVFFLGALMAIPAVYTELFLISALGYITLPKYAAIIISNIIAVALVEELAKYGAVWLREQAVGQNRNLDEPVDFVIYMVVAALGFAAAENLLFLLLAAKEQLAANATLLNPDGMISLWFISSFRAITAIFLHTLCSGIIGYHMAMAFCHQERKLGILAAGFVTISGLHGLYNFSIIIIESEKNMAFFLVPLAIIFFMALALYAQFQKLLKMKSVCDVNIGKKNANR